MGKLRLHLCKTTVDQNLLYAFVYLCDYVIREKNMEREILDCPQGLNRVGHRRLGRKGCQAKGKVG